MTGFLISIAYFLLFCFVISKITFFKDDAISKRGFIALFGLKIIVSIILTAIYTHYYTNRETADIFKYFDDSKIMFDALFEKPLDYFKMLFAIGNDNAYFTESYYTKMNFWIKPDNGSYNDNNHLIIRFNALARIFSFGYFQAHNIFINFLSLIGLTAIYKAFKSEYNSTNKLLFIALLLLPSLLFWGSGLLKESIILFGLGLFTYSFFKLFKHPNLLSFGLLLFSLALIAYTKLYILAALLIPTIGYIINSILKRKRHLGYITATLVCFLISLVAPKLNTEWDIYQKIALKQKEFNVLINNVSTSSSFKIVEITDAPSILKNIPNAINNTLLRPYPWECSSPFVWLSLLENWLIILLIITTIVFRKKKNINYNIVYFTFTFAFSLFVLIGLTTPIFGAIVRYKIPATLFLIIGLLAIIDIEKLKSKFAFLNKII